MKQRILAIFLMALPFLVAACQSGPKVAEVTPLGSSKVGYLVEGWFNKDGTFTGTDLDKQSGSSKYNFSVNYLSGKNVDGFKKAQLTVSNETKSFMSLQYRFLWYDNEGVEVEPDASSWQPLHLSGKLSRTVHSVSRRPEATHFQVYIREIKK